MDIWLVLLDVVVLLGAGALLGGLFERARQSAIIGFLLAGALLGPNALHVIRSSEEVLAVSELGVALLLFVIGLEFSWGRLRRMGRVAFGSGAVQVLSTGAVAGGAAAMLGLSPSASLTIGAACALSSTACVLRVLTAREEVEHVHGERALGILLFQDMAVVPLVLLVSVLSEGGTAWEIALSAARAAGVGLALVAVLYVTFYLAVPRLLGSLSSRSNRELPLLIAIVSGLGSGVVAHAAGVSPALGAFVAGMLLAESPFAVQIRADVSSLKTLLLTLFFTAIGMLTDAAWIADNALLVGGVVLAVVVGKAALVFASLRLFDGRVRSSLAAGICLGQIGEFSFVLADIARGSLLDDELFLLVVSTTVITMTLTPYLVAGSTRLAARLTGKRSLPRPHEEREPDDAERGIVVGFGPAGRAAAERLAELGCRVVVVDSDHTATLAARALGYETVTGDARYAEVLDHAGLGAARFLVVTVPAADVALQVVRHVRINAPGVPVVARGRFHHSLPDLRGAGAHLVIDEEQEVGRLIARAYEELRGTDGANSGGA